MNNQGARVYRSKYLRLIELDRRIRAGNYPNAISFAKEWEVSRRTIVRDIEFMRDCLRAPIMYDSRKHGYYFTDSKWTLPKVELTELDVMHVLLAEQMARQYSGTPVAEILDSVFEKLKPLLSEPVSIDPAFIENHFSFYGMPSRPVSEMVWVALCRAVREQRTVSINYNSVSSGIRGERQVDPLHLACLSNEWYLIAFDLKHQGIQQYAVSRIYGIPSLTENHFEREFSPEKYFENRFGRFVGQDGKIYEVRIRFDKEVARWLEERIWHPMQTFQPHRDGSATLSFPSPSLYEIKRWVLQWGRHARVLAPKELIRGQHGVRPPFAIWMSSDFESTFLEFGLKSFVLLKRCFAPYAGIR
ncbi:MAG: WYL domain-containing transcriptional regulator, partial [Planctomycetota bacterium]|nr:WYL domain-containing transcriptional regulator [Planctomycetota bacterium]